jgi:hypothetical protein
VESPIANSDEDVAQLSLAQLNHQISLTKLRLARTSNANGRAMIGKRLGWLERHREHLYGVAAPRRARWDP